MNRTKWLTGLTLALAALLGAEQANAGASCLTRDRCRALSKTYVANAHVSCFVVVPVPLCINRGSSCGTASANCDWRACLTGGGRARATNGPAGCVTAVERWGLGLAGDLSFDPADDPTLLMGDDDGGGSEILSNAVFDAAARTVEIRLDSGRLAARPDGLGQRLRVWIFHAPEGGDEDPEPNADNTLWTGGVTLLGGKLAVTGFDPAAIALSTDDLGRTVATFADLVTVVPLDLSADELADVAVKVLADEVAP